MREAKWYTYAGKTLTLKEWSEETGIPLSVLKSRMYAAKWDIERALTTPAQERNKRYTYDGRNLTLREWSEETGLSAHVIYTRLNSLGWSIDRALTNDLDRGNRGARLYEYEGKRLTLREWSELKGISLSTLSVRVYTLKMTMEEALTKPVRVKGKTYRVGDKELTLAEWSKERDFLYGSLYYWVVKKGMSVSDALDYLSNKKKY